MVAAHDPNFKKAEFENDTRNVSDLWSKAIQTYNETAEATLVAGKFSDTQAMINFGTQEMNQFHKWRHDDKKVDKLRKLFIGNIGFIEAGMKQVISAASAAFPPAAAVGTAVTLVLSAAKSVSADYDVIINFFEDMNNFLQRVSIVATRVPRKQAYQNALLDVFSSFLRMIGLAHKTISLGRFKKWAINAVFGGDSDLSGGRKTMDVSLARLQSATEFAVLDNSENMLDKQHDLEATLAEYQQELLQNQRVQQRLASSQSLALQNISDTLQECKDDIKKLLDFAKQQREESKQPSKQDDDTGKNSANRVRSLIGEVPDTNSLIRELEKHQIEGMGTWIFENPLWSKWTNEKSNEPYLLTLEGPPGIGKSFMSLTIYRHLQELAQKDTDHRSCATFFSFGRDEADFHEVKHALRSIAVQLADNYPEIRHCLEAKIEDEALLFACSQKAKEDPFAWWDFFVCDVFSADFDYRLYLVFDGLDELFSDEERQIFRDLVAKIEQHKSKVKIIATDRLQSLDGPADRLEVITMDREVISTDLRKLIWDRLHNSDSAYEGVRRLRKSTKQKLARKLEQHADGLLYAEQMLRYLSGIGRESAINKLLDESLPNDLIGLYEMVLDRVKRRLDSVSLPIMRNIVIWTTFALRWLSLAELNALGRLLFPEQADIVEEKLLDEFAPFFEMSYLAADVHDIDASVDADVLFSDDTISYSEADQIDSKIRVKLRERTMKTFFGADTDSQNEFTMTSSRAHALIFLTSARMILDSEPGATLDSATKSIFDYATTNCFRHWDRISPSEHTDQENIEICSKFAEVIASCKYAKAVMYLPFDMGVSGYIGPDGAGNFSTANFLEKWKTWSGVASQLPLEQEVCAYWAEGPEMAVWPVVKSYVASWLNSTNNVDAWKAYLFAADAIESTRNKDLLDKPFGDGAPAVADSEGEGIEELMNLVRLCDIELDQKVHYPYAIVLVNKGKHATAATAYEEVLKYTSDKRLIARCLSNLGLLNNTLKDWEQAIYWIDEALRAMTGWLDMSLEVIDPVSDTAQNMTNGAMAIYQANPDQKLTTMDAEDMRKVLGDALITKSFAKFSLMQYAEAAALLRQSRLCRPDIIPATVLLQELEYLWEAGPNYAEIMDCLMDFKAIERLNLLTSPTLTGEMRLKRDRLLLLASARSQRSNDILKIYEEVVTVLDAEEAGAPLRIYVAQLKVLQHDNSGAKALLDQVLDSVTEQSYYKLTETEPGDVAISAIGCLSDILLAEFRNSNNSVEKYQLALDIKGLPQRSLASTTTITRSSWIPPQLVLARMLQKLGPASEYERVMNQIMEVIMTNLTDSTSANDAENIDALAKLLFMMPTMQRLSELVSSCRFYMLDGDGDGDGDGNGDGDEAQNGEQTKSGKQSEAEYDLVTDKEQDTFCDGICFPATRFNSWDASNPLRVCSVCVDCCLCTGCYDTRMQWNDDPSSKPETEPDFCCSNGQYITGPIEGWRGIKNGVIYLDSDVTGVISKGEPVDGSENAMKQIVFTDLLEQIQVAWKKAWEEYWKGI